jgi:uncharacterized protein YtpQ (UPF0354 family)
MGNGNDSLLSGRISKMEKTVECKTRIDYRSRTVFDLYQETIARGMLVYAMDDGDKYRLVARSLRERAFAAEMAFQRKEVISLAARFEVLAIEADHIQEHLVDTLFAPRAVRSPLRNLPIWHLPHTGG